MNYRPRQVYHLSRTARRWGYRLMLGVAVGVTAGLAAAALEWGIDQGTSLLIDRYSHPAGASVFRFDWMVLLLPAMGGLIAGALAMWLARRSPGHGVDQLTEAFHHKFGQQPLRGPAVKAAGMVLVISSGGSAGPEGPIAALGSAVGSAFGRLFHLSPRERRILLLAGCAAGIGAIFRCPLGGALFGTSIIYSEPGFETDAIVTAFIASVIGYSTFMLALGYQGPILTGVSALQFTQPINLLWYAVLGPVCGVFGIFFYYCMRLVERVIVPKAPLPRWLMPGLGGLATGAIACLLPQVMDGRYAFLQNVLSGSVFVDAGVGQSWWLWAGLLGLIAAFKCIATGFTVGSGAPGGVLGPSVFIGGAVGAAMGALGLALFPGSFSESMRQALIPVAMAGMLSATMRAPLASMVMVMEMTGSYGLIAPLMLVCITSYLVARPWGLNRQQVPTSAESPAHVADPIIHLLESVTVAQIMVRRWPQTVEPGTLLSKIVGELEPGTQPVIAVAEGQKLVGLITARELGVVLSAGVVSQALVAADAMIPPQSTLAPTDDVYTALHVFRQSHEEALPIIGAKGVWLGMLSRSRVAEVLRQRLSQYSSQVLHEHAVLRTLENDIRVEHMLLSVPSDGLVVQRLFVPIDVVGKTLRASDFRRRYQTEVIGIEQPDGTLQCPPDIDAPLHTGQRLLAIMRPPGDQSAEP